MSKPPRGIESCVEIVILPAASSGRRVLLDEGANLNGVLIAHIQVAAETIVLYLGITVGFMECFWLRSGGRSVINASTVISRRLSLKLNLIERHKSDSAGSSII